jgi:hypothetical protein
MVIKWVTEEFDLQDMLNQLEPLEPLEQSIKSRLAQLGDVCGWIATDADVSRQKIIVDALIWTEPQEQLPTRSSGGDRAG